MVLLTDGDETCGSDPVGSAAALFAAGIRTLVIAFCFTPPNANLDSIAAAGAGDPSETAVYVQFDEIELALALMSIIVDSVLVEVCNGVDDDCDTLVDEGFALGVPCDNGMTGACYLEGVTVCRADGLGVERSSGPVTPPEDPEVTCDGSDNDCDCPGDTNGDGCVCCAGDYNVDEGLTNACGTCGPPPLEVCDWLDNDCNTLVDDGIPTTEAMVNIAYNHPVFGALDFWIYTYEASRPDATAMNAGIVDSRPQSVPGVLPWTMTTWGGAAAACAAGGKRLCTEAEWQAACESDELRVWPYGLSDTDYVPDYCNDNAYDFDPGTAVDDDGLLPTGALTDCVTKDGIFDMSGNVKEWTSTQVSSAPDPEAWRIRGGGFDSPAAGTRCDFDFSAGTGAYVFGNLGFRCCSDTPP